ncbi:MAG TPA: gas vesicle protein K [Labilithrix sp.]|nr:gas vesicle protein K [Labilithrix sp.]
MTGKKKAKSTATPKEKTKAQRSSRKKKSVNVAELRVREIESIREVVEQRSAELLPRWNANPEDVQKSVAQLVLALVEFLRQLLERQAIRRMEAETLEPEEVERIGLALMRLEETVHDLAARFGLAPEELNLDLGPLGRLT